MLFSVNNEDVLKRYFNLEKKNNLLEPKEGLILGNMFLICMSHIKITSRENL